VRRIENEAELDAAFEDFMRMHQRPWTSAGEPGAFAQARAAAFHREVAKECLRRGWLSLSFLQLDGRTACANYSFRVGRKLEFYLSGSADFAAARKFAPGILLHVYSMQQAIAEGAQTYDFLRGTERYKYELGAQDVPNWALIAFPPRAALTKLKHRIDMLERRAGARLKQATVRAKQEGS
jgi:CelD/BcsL family acetyltransferase involved in cellulose biosynthesis